MSTLNFRGSSPAGFKAEIRKTSNLDYRHDEEGYSLFTWRDTGTGVYLWREKHSLDWQSAFQSAKDWLDTSGE